VTVHRSLSCSEWARCLDQRTWSPEESGRLFRPEVAAGRLLIREPFDMRPGSVWGTGGRGCTLIGGKYKIIYFILNYVDAVQTLSKFIIKRDHPVSM
jgi:hypothetical protein